MLYCIRIFTNTCEVTMQVKRAIGKVVCITQTTNILRIHVLVLSLHIVCFPIVIKALLHDFNPDI